MAGIQRNKPKEKKINYHRQTGPGHSFSLLQNLTLGNTRREGKVDRVPAVPSKFCGNEERPHPPHSESRQSRSQKLKEKRVCIDFLTFLRGMNGDMDVLDS